MANIDTTHIRNIILLSHSGAGKTAITETALHTSGVTSRLGKIEEGNTASDYEPEEQKRNSSIQTSILPCPWRDHKINFIDTPGYADFRGQVISGIRVADGAVIVVSGPSGVEVGTQQMWEMAEEKKLPKIIFVNKMDRENVDFNRVIQELTDTFGRQCVPLQVPIGSEENFSGVINLLSGGGNTPDELKSDIENALERLIEAIAETDDDLATKYLEGEELSPEEITKGLKQGVKSGTIVPIIMGAATSSIGDTDLMNLIVDLMPSPLESIPAKGKNDSDGSEMDLTYDSNGPLAAFVFETSADPFVGKLSYFRIYNGTFKSDSQVLNVTRGETERVAQIFVVRGKDQEAASELASGDIGAVAKLSSVITGDTLTNKENPISLPGLDFPTPVYKMAAYPKSKADLDKLTTALARISEEDPSLNLEREPNTLEMLLGGLGETHVEMAVEKMKRKFGVEIELQTPKVPYKETINSTSTVEYRHKKQSGGHGQFGHVVLELQPLARGKGFEFGQKVVGGAVPREYIPAVEKGVNKAKSEGILGGYPVVDIKATLVDGSYHPVDSSGISFEIAATHAFAKGIDQARPVLLEPVMLAKVTVPESYTGEVMGDLNSKRAKILGMTPQNNNLTLVEAEVPQAEMLRYATELRSQTQGLGSFTIEFDHYEEVPAHITKNVIESVAASEAKD